MGLNLMILRDKKLFQGRIGSPWNVGIACL